jgi:hypothetical protein
LTRSTRSNRAGRGTIFAERISVSGRSEDIRRRWRRTRRPTRIFALDSNQSPTSNDTGQPIAQLQGAVTFRSRQRVVASSSLVSRDAGSAQHGCGDTDLTPGCVADAPSLGVVAGNSHELGFELGRGWGIVGGGEFGLEVDALLDEL